MVNGIKEKLIKKRFGINMSKISKNNKLVKSDLKIDTSFIKDGEINSFKDIELDKNKLYIITIYYNPSDFHNKYVARLFEIGWKPYPTKFHTIRDTLEEIRKTIPITMSRIERNKNDDSVIVESYI